MTEETHKENPEQPQQLLEFEYYILEVIKSDASLSSVFSSEIIKENPDMKKLEEIVSIVSEAKRNDAIAAKRKVLHTIENQVQSAQEVLREVGVQNTCDAYADLVVLLTKRNEPVTYPLRIELDFVQRLPDQTSLHHQSPQHYDVTIRDYAIGMNLFDVLYKLLAIGDTQKKEKQYYVGGHGRGFKPSISFCDSVIIDSFGRRTRIRKEVSRTGMNDKETSRTGEKEINSNGTNGTNYIIQIGETSDVKEGTRITLEHLVLAETPLNAVKRFAGNLTEEFDFRVNGVKINKGIGKNKVGSVVYAQTHSISGDRNGNRSGDKTRELCIEERLMACSQDVEGEEVQQGPMTLFTKPAEMSFLRRVLKMPTGYLFSRSRNKLPDEVEKIIHDEKQKPYKKFYEFLMDNLGRIGAHEFRFLDYFTRTFDEWDEILAKAYKYSRNALIVFATLAISTLILTYAKPYLLKLNQTMNKALNEFVYGNSNYDDDDSDRATRSVITRESYDTNKLNLPQTFLPQVNKMLFVTGMTCKDSQCREKSQEQQAKQTAEEFVFSRYIPENKDIFFKLFSYNTLRTDGSWTNTDVDGCITSKATWVNIQDTVSVVSVALKLNISDETILPLPVGYFTTPELMYGCASLFDNQCMTDGGDYDTVFIKGCQGRMHEPIQFHARPVNLTADSIEYVLNTKLKSKKKGSLFVRHNEKVKHFFEVPFKIAYPFEVEKKLRMIDRDLKKRRIKYYETLAEKVTEVFRDYFIYNTSPENARRFFKVDNYVNGALELQGVDCDTANNPLAATLRQRYNLPTRLAVGIQGVQGVLDKRNGHAVTEVYIPGKGWSEYDATPSRISEEAVISKLDIRREYGSEEYNLKNASGKSGSQKTKTNIVNNDAEKEKEWRKKQAEEKGDENNLKGKINKRDVVASKVERADKETKKDKEQKEEDGTSIETKNILNTIAYTLLIGSGLWFIAAGINWLRSRRNEKRIWDEPIVDVYVKDNQYNADKKDGTNNTEMDNAGKTAQVLDGIRVDKISLNQGIEYLLDERLYYDQNVVENGIDELKNDDKEEGFYVKDYGFYVVILESASKRKRVISPSKAKDEADNINEKSDTEEDDSNEEPVEQEQEKTEQENVYQNEAQKAEQQKSPKKIRRKKATSAFFDLDGDIGGILADISLSEKALRGKHIDSEKYVEFYQTQFDTLQDIARDICEANEYRTPTLNGEHQFVRNKKLFALRKKIWSKTIYINLDNERLHQDESSLRTNAGVLDSLIYTIMLANNVSLERFNTIKKAYLNRAYIK